MASSVDPLGDLDALLADLQTSIPTGPSASQSPPPPVQQAYSPPPQQPPSSFTQHDSSHRSPQHYSPPEQNVDRGFTPHTNGGTSYPLNGASEPTYTNGDVDPRGGYNPQRVYYQESKEEVRTETSSSGPNPAPGQGNELDSLLSELNSTRYTASSKERTNGAPLTGSGTRPTVDSLLNELNSVSSSQQQSSRLVQQQQQQSMAPQPVTASTATRDLDDLMAELSDFKLNRNDTYAKPEKPKSPSPPAPAPPPPPKEPSPPPLANELDCMLGSLANHMTEQGVTTTQKGCCCACDKPIVGQVITALGKTWHPEHFTCTHCSSELGSKNFFERDGQPYCEACYHELFSPRCAYCDGSILDKCVTALDKNWHPDHFFCAQCGTTFGEEGFHEKDGKAYCREDYYNMFAPKCGGCNSPIMENYISALNAQWHPECFVCRDCKQPVTGKSYYAMEGKPVCAACIGVSDDDEDAEEDE